MFSLRTLGDFWTKLYCSLNTVLIGILPCPSSMRLLQKKETLLAGVWDFADEHQHILHRREPFASTESLVQLLPPGRQRGAKKVMWSQLKSISKWPHVASVPPLLSLEEPCSIIVGSRLLFRHENLSPNGLGSQDLLWHRENAKEWCLCGRSEAS